MNPLGILGPFRGEWLVVHLFDRVKTRYRTECIYRTDDSGRADAILAACGLAYARGSYEVSRGWPQVLPLRSPIFVVDYSDRWRITERHPRFSFGDRVLYTTQSEVDADLAIVAIRRAATLAAWK